MKERCRIARAPSGTEGARISFRGVIKITEKEKIEERVKDVSREKRITCAEAWSIAEELNVPRKVVGDACNELKIKIHSCQLGCF